MSSDARASEASPEREAERGAARRTEERDEKNARRRASWSGIRDRLLSSVWLWMLLLVAVGMAVLIPRGAFVSSEVLVDQIASRDYIAPRDLLLLDEETTNDKRLRARDSVLPVYDYDVSKEVTQDEQIVRLFATGRELLAAKEEQPLPRETGAEDGGDPLLEALQAATTIRLSREQYELLASRRFSQDLEDLVRELVRSVLRSGVVANKELLLEHRMRGISLRDLGTGSERAQLDLYEYLGYPDEVRRFLEVEVSRWPGWRRAQRRLLVDFLLLNVPPNISLNLSATRSRQESAATAVEPVYNQVRQGEIIARKGDRLDASQVRTLSEVVGTKSTLQQLLPLLGNFVLLLMVGAGIVQGIRRTRLVRTTDPRALGGVFLLLLIAIAAGKVCLMIGGSLSETFENPALKSIRSYAWATPFASLALVCSLLYGRGAAMLAALGYSIVVGRLLDAEPYAATLYVLATSLAAIYALDQLKQRSAVIRAGLLVGLVGAAVALTVALLGDPEALTPARAGFDLACALIGGLLVAAAAGFLVPLVEALLPVTTDIKLLELSDTNLPLLRRVAFEAPGSFQHSLMVANLAKAACEEIDANAVLAYTAGLYHDVGKVRRPQYFVENQAEGLNPHDKLAPSMSAQIVIDHVLYGVELARQHGLPQPIIDAIEQHHGSRQLSFFLAKARELLGADQVDESKYRYPGPRPQNKVMGVLMLADAVEAASRTLHQPADEVLQGLLDRLFGDVVQDGQLQECDLTLADLEVVSRIFLRVLRTIHHRRIDYPGYDFDGDAAGRGLRAVEAR